jgi:hypothetical protein
MPSDQSTHTAGELSARKAIRILTGKNVQDVSEYLNRNSPRYQKMVDMVARELRAYSLIY